MGDFSAKNLANGRLANSTGDLFTVTAPALSAIVRSLILVNTSGSEVTVNMYAHFGVADRCFVPLNLKLRPGDKYEDTSSLTLEVGDKIRGVASVDNVIDFIISGVVEQ